MTEHPFITAARECQCRHGKQFAEGCDYCDQFHDADMIAYALASMESVYIGEVNDIVRKAREYMRKWNP